MLTLGYDGSKPTCSKTLPCENIKTIEPVPEWPEWIDNIIENKEETADISERKGSTKMIEEPADWPSSEESDTEEIIKKLTKSPKKMEKLEINIDTVKQGKEEAPTQTNQYENNEIRPPNYTRENKTIEKKRKRYIKITVYEELSDSEEGADRLVKLLKTSNLGREE